MPNGDSNYKLGEVVGQMSEIKDLITGIRADIRKIHEELAYLDKVKGAISVLRFIVTFLGAGVVVNFLLWLFQH